MQKRILWGLAFLCLHIFPQQYIYESNQSLFDLTNQTGVTGLTSGDDSISSVFNLGFDFTFYDTTFSTARMATNGCLHFGSTGSGCNDYTPDPLPRFNYTLYPFYTDLIAANTNSKMLAKNFNDKIVFGWYDLKEYHRTSSNNFEVILWNNDSYEFRYGALDIIQHDVLIGEQGTSDEIYTYYYHDECNTGTTNTSSCYSYDWNTSDKNDNLENGGSLYYSSIDCSDPLNDSSCDGYEQAYLTQQCNLDSLYSTSCTGYEEAYLAQQCNSNPLYSQECTGYEQAFHDEECAKDPQYKPTCTGYIPEVLAIVAIQSGEDYEVYTIDEEQNQEFYFIEEQDTLFEEEPYVPEYIEETYTEDFVEDFTGIEDFTDVENVIIENEIINVTEPEELIQTFVMLETIEEIDEILEEENIIEEEGIEEILEELKEEIKEEVEEKVEETIEEDKNVNGKNRIAEGLKVVNQTLQVARTSYTTMNNTSSAENSNNQARAQSLNSTGLTSSPSMSDQVLASSVQTNNVLESFSNDSVSSTNISVVPLFTVDGNTALVDVQINNIENEINSMMSTVMTASEADDIAAQIVADNLKEEQEELEEEQKETGEYGDQTSLIAYLGYVPAFEVYKDFEIPNAKTWYEPRYIYADVSMQDNSSAFNGLTNKNINTMATMISQQPRL